MKAPWLAAAAAAISVVTLCGASARQPISDVEEGRQFAEMVCSGCHAVGRNGDSPHRDAKPFRVIVTLYPPEDLAEPFAEGIVVGHPGMPPFALTPTRNRQLIAYLRSLKEAGAKPGV